MRVLLLAPHPYYQVRGTPIDVDLLVRMLSERGDTVDLLVYHEGEDVAYPGVTLHRIPHLPFVRGIRPGPSWKKLVCDAVFFWCAIRLAIRLRPQLIHAVEEAAIMARAIRAFGGPPYIYDMDSWLSEQTEVKYPALAWLFRPLRWAERWVCRGAEVVVPVCDALGTVARRAGARRVTVLRDISLLSFEAFSEGARRDLEPERSTGAPVVMYVGNLERYQGVDLLLESFALAHREVPEARLIIIGGKCEEIKAYVRRVAALGLEGTVRFLGPRPVELLGAYLRLADVLVSPRISGSNTPMKLFSYLESGTAVLATDLSTHTQAISQTVALLCAPQPAPFAKGLVWLLRDPALRVGLGEAAKRLVAERHSLEVFRKTVRELCEHLEWFVGSPTLDTSDAPSKGGAAAR